MFSPSLTEIPLGPVTLQANLALPSDARALVVFSHGSGSSRLSPRNRFVAERVRREGLGTLLFDLLTPEEDEVYATRFDIDLLTQRLVAVTRWLSGNPQTAELALGYFGASTGAASALRAAAQLGERIGAVVSRGGRPDLALEVLPQVKAPTLLIVGGEDTQVLALNRKAYARLGGEKRLAVVPGATHLFEEPGALENAADLAAAWFAEHLTATEPSRRTSVGRSTTAPEPPAAAR